MMIKRSTQLFTFLLLICSLHGKAQDQVSYGSFGKLTMYHPAQTPKSLVLFVSGDGGWQFGVVNMARYLAQQGALVAGIDAKRFAKAMVRQKKPCYYPAADFEQLSLFLQKKYKFTTYQKPILAGYSYGATLVYGLIAQAPAGTFKGGIALGFCPDIDIPKPLCEGSGLRSHVLKPGKSYDLDKVEKLAAPFIVLNGVKDQTCDYESNAAFLKGIGNAKLITLPKVGHGFSIEDNWLPQFKSAYAALVNPVQPVAMPSTLKTSMPISIIEPKISTKSVMFMISGDGGWTSFDQGLADQFATEGIKVIGLDAQKYFWNAKTPEQTTVDIANVLNFFQEHEPNIPISIMGYSFGACVAPFVANRLPENLKKNLHAVALLSPDSRGDFEIHVTDMLSFGSDHEPYDVVAELKKTKVKKVCIFGNDEDRDNTAKFNATGANVTTLPGGHHFNNDYGSIVKAVVKTIAEK